MKFITIKFTVNSTSRFPFTARTNRQMQLTKDLSSLEARHYLGPESCSRGVRPCTTLQRGCCCSFTPPLDLSHEIMTSSTNWKYIIDCNVMLWSQATNMHQKCDLCMVPEICIQTDSQKDRQTDLHTRHGLIG